MYNQKAECVLIQIKCITDKQNTDLEINKKKTILKKKFIYDVLKQRRNSKTQYKHEQWRHTE